MCQMTALGGGFSTEWDNFAREEYVIRQGGASRDAPSSGAVQG